MIICNNLDEEKMKKIVMIAAPVHPVPPRKGAAVEWWIYQVCCRLANVEPHIISIAADGYADEERCDGVTFHRIRIGRLYRRVFQKILGLDPYSYGRRVALRLATISPDIVHVHNAPALFTELVRYYRGSAHFILHMHNDMLIEKFPPDAVLFTVSRYLKNWYVTCLPNAQIRIVTNGVDTETFRPLSASKTVELRTRLRLLADKKIILYAGRVSPEKGPLDLVHAFGELRKIRRDVLLVLVGEIRTGADRRGDYGRQLLAACETVKDDCYRVGTVDPAHIHEFYQVADLVVVPSEFEEPFGMVAIEAMAAGIPVLAANKGGLREFVIPHETGFLIADTRDYIEFAQQMHELLDHPSKLKRVRRNARAYVEQHHSWDIVCRDLERAYDTILTNHETN